MTADIRTIVEPYPATPARHGLVASAYEALDVLVRGVGLETPLYGDVDSIRRTDPERYDQLMHRWEIGGYTITPENCVSATSWDPDCANWPTSGADGPDGAKTALSDAPANEAPYNVAPFVIETGFMCDAKGFQVVDYQGRARRQLEASTSKAIEFEFWTGTMKPGNPNLDTGATVLNGGAALEPPEALFMLGQYLSNIGNGGIGMIHAPTFLVDEWMYTMGGAAIKEQGDRLRTVTRGDIIVAGTGYPGTGPDGLPVAGGQVWAFATNIVTYRLGEISVYPDRIGEALNRLNNDIEYRALRQAAVGFDPCRHAAVLVNSTFASDIGASS